LVPELAAEVPLVGWCESAGDIGRRIHRVASAHRDLPTASRVLLPAVLVVDELQHLARGVEIVAGDDVRAGPQVVLVNCLDDLRCFKVGRSGPHTEFIGGGAAVHVDAASLEFGAGRAVVDQQLAGRQSLDDSSSRHVLSFR
jgi:hypothetical protein